MGIAKEGKKVETENYDEIDQKILGLTIDQPAIKSSEIGQLLGISDQLVRWRCGSDNMFRLFVKTVV